MIIIEHVRYLLAVYRIDALKFSAATRSARYRRDRLSASCTSIAGRDCNNRGNCVANSLCRVRETAMPNVAKCVFTRFCDARSRFTELQLASGPRFDNSSIDSSPERSSHR